MTGGDRAPTIPGIDDLQLVGRGGFAEVYRGHQPAFRRDVAVKVLLRSGLGEDDRRRFDRECQAMGTLSEHPGIVTLYDAGFTDDGRPYLIMAYIRDGTLGDALAADGPLGWEEVTRLGVRLAGALETAHLAGVLHRDIKPANVLRAAYGAQLSDFGIARIAGAHETRSGVITASVAHAAPEILDGRAPTFQADVYGLASTLYEALTGRPAFVQDTDEGLLPLIRRVVTDDPPDLRERGVPDPVARVIEKAMAKRPEDRYETAREFGLALRAAQAVLGIAVTDLVVITPHAAGIESPEAAGHVDPEAAGHADPESGVAGTSGTPRGPAGDETTDLTPATATSEAPARDPRSTTVLGGATTPPAGGGRAAELADPRPADHDDGRRRGVGTAVLAAAVLLAVVALIGGLILLTRDDPATTGSTTPPTAVGDTTPESTAAPESTAVPATTTAPGTTEGGTTPPPTTAEPPPGSDVRVGIVIPSAEPTHPVVAGVRRAAEDLGLPFEVADPEVAPDQAVFDQIADGQNTIVVVARHPFRQATADAVRASAEAHPEVDYVLFGADVDAANVTSYPFADHEGSFLVGAAAALSSSTGRVGFLGAVDDEEIRAFEAGFVSGVRHVSPTTQIDVRYLADTADVTPSDGDVAALATELYAAGADVVYGAGTMGTELFEAAAATGNWAIGADVDEAATAPPELAPSILTSMVRPYEPLAHAAVIALAQGEDPLEISVVDVSAGVGWATTGGHVDALDAQLTQLADDVKVQTVVVPAVVEQRPLAPLGPECPPEGCQVRIIEVEREGEELRLTLEANWVMDTGGQHAHYFFSPRYAPEQVGADSPSRFGVAPGDWDLDDSYPQYVTEGAVSLSQLGEDTDMICVTGADAGHNVLDPTLFSCSSFAAVD